MKIVVILFLLVIIYCLGSGVFYLVRAGTEPGKLARALTWRIALSFSLFIFLFIAYFFGWIQPHGFAVMPPGGH